jgi:hypothetical protein
VADITSESVADFVGMRTFSAGSPSIPILDREGRHKIGGDGKKQYTALLTFEGTGRDLWNRAVITALTAAGITPRAEGGGA